MVIYIGAEFFLLFTSGEMFFIIDNWGEVFFTSGEICFGNLHLGRVFFGDFSVLC